MIIADGIPTTYTKQFPEDMAVQALLAAYLTHGDTENLLNWELWRKSWPSRQDFADSMPILWPTVLGGPQWPPSNNKNKDVVDLDKPGFFPPSISGRWNSLKPGPKTRKYELDHQNILPKQVQLMSKAWFDVVAVYPETEWDTFSYHWLIVNTRSFYWIGLGQEAPEDPNDAMGLVPFADYFNHADVAVCFFFWNWRCVLFSGLTLFYAQRDVKFDENEYVFCATKDYEEGDEVYMNYGSHPNDTLLAECENFIPPLI
jgi:hypothetical protein